MLKPATDEPGCPARLSPALLLYNGDFIDIVPHQLICTGTSTSEAPLRGSCMSTDGSTVSVEPRHCLLWSTMHLHNWTVLIKQTGQNVMIKLDQVVKRTRLVQHTDQTPQDPMQKRHVYIVVQRRPQRLYLSVLHQNEYVGSCISTDAK